MSQVPDARRAPGSSGPRIQPHPQRRRAPQSPDRRPHLRHHGPVADRLGAVAGLALPLFRQGGQERRHPVPGTWPIPARIGGSLLRLAHPGGGVAPARVPGGRERRAVHPQPRRHRRCAQEDRRTPGRLARDESECRRDQPHVPGGRILRPTHDGPVRDASAARGAHSTPRSEFRRDVPGGAADRRRAGGIGPATGGSNPADPAGRAERGGPRSSRSWQAPPRRPPPSATRNRTTSATPPSCRRKSPTSFGTPPRTRSAPAP